VAIAFLASSRSLVIAFCGVPLGANSPTHSENSTSWPSSLSVGTSGNEAARLDEKQASARALPALIWVLAAAIDDTRTCELLPRSAVSAGPPPLVGRCLIFMPADFMKRAVGRCKAP